MDPISDTKKMVPNGTYASRELISMLEGIIELNQFEIDDQVTKTNKLKGITEITLNLDELNNSDNLKNGRPSNELLTYHRSDKYQKSTRVPEKCEWFHDHGKIVLKVHKIVPRGGVFVYFFCPRAVISQKFSARGQGI